jgi:S-adenosylmethionine:tRNA ribosyltransferase-isomerase
MKPDAAPLLTADFDYHLPPELIAQEPIEPRDAARMLVAELSNDAIAHRRVAELDQYVRPGDLLVINRTRVFPARLLGTKDTGGAVEVLLVRKLSEHDAPRERWSCFIGGKVKVGTVITIAEARVEVLTCCADGAREISFGPGEKAFALAERVGHVPLPPYIKRADRPDDRARYQSVFAERDGSVAAPTASLHFTTELIERLRARGVGFADVDLAIGPGTFKPVDAEKITDHAIHAEYCECPASTVAAVMRCRASGGRVIAVGTTVVRTLETAAAQPGGLAPYRGLSSLFLHPPKQLMVVDGLLTNFHLPRSSLLMLVACLTGVERLLELYRQAIADGYRFYSYGDAMLILPRI